MKKQTIGPGRKLAEEKSSILSQNRNNGIREG